MIIDFLELFTEKDGDALTAEAPSTYTVDFGQESPTTGKDSGEPNVTFALVTGAGCDVTVSLQDSDTEEGEFTDCAGPITFTGGEAGAQVAIPMPLRHKRFVRAYFKVGGTPADGALIKAFITSGYQDNPPFKQAPELGQNF